ncbi:DUF5908 family protein [Chitinophaga vietnamensis]|uniref:DUF5908 family protein n=1 Tax=Chitinophaga vietnamensis TaxID=2593957 RepID=UPI001375A060|nr:DUF5908 family protein [Chitinophaga vietnamensis]
MPVQINEVIIKTVIDPPGNSSGSGTPVASPQPSGKDTEVVEKVLEIIREKNER